MNQSELGSKILRCRQNKNMTQEELALRIGVTPQALSKWERGQSMPDIGLLAELSRLLHVSADYLLGTESGRFTENGDDRAQQQIRKNLRSCLEPLELCFGKALVSVFTDRSYVVEGIVQMRVTLSEEGILMPLVRVRDELTLGEWEFQILSYERVLCSGEVPQGAGDEGGYLFERLEWTVRERYAEILNRDLVKELTDNLAVRYPALIIGTVPERISYGFLLEILRRFLSRGNSCKYLCMVIETADRILCSNPGASADEIAEELDAERKGGSNIYKL